MKRYWLWAIILLLAACSPAFAPRGAGGTAGGAGAFDSNGERIYFTATSDRGSAITYTGGAAFGGTMMGGGNLACASCHGPDGRGGPHTMHMQLMDTPDIRWSVLSAEGEHADDHGDTHVAYDLESFRLAVGEGSHPDGEPLDRNMPRWNISDSDLADLADYLQSLP